MGNGADRLEPGSRAAQLAQDLRRGFAPPTPGDFGLLPPSALDYPWAEGTKPLWVQEYEANRAVHERALEEIAATTWDSFVGDLRAGRQRDLLAEHDRLAERLSEGRLEQARLSLHMCRLIAAYEVVSALDYALFGPLYGQEGQRPLSATLVCDVPSAEHRLPEERMAEGWRMGPPDPARCLWLRDQRFCLTPPFDEGEWEHLEPETTDWLAPSGEGGGGSTRVCRRLPPLTLGAMSKSTRYAPEVRQRAVRLLFDHEHAHPSRWAAVRSVAEKTGCTAETLRSWVRQAERDHGRRAGRLDRRPSAPEGAGAREPRAAPRQREPPGGVGLSRTGGARPPAEVMVAFTDDHRADYGVEPICAVLPIAPSTYYAAKARRADPALRSVRAQDAPCGRRPTRRSAPRSNGCGTRTARSMGPRRSGSN